MIKKLDMDVMCFNALYKLELNKDYIEILKEREIINSNIDEKNFYINRSLECLLSHYLIILYGRLFII